MREEEWVDAVLLGALERIEFGWEQGSLYGDGGGLAVSDEDALTFCLVGAVNASAARAALRLPRSLAGRSAGSCAHLAKIGDPPPPS